MNKEVWRDVNGSVINIGPWDYGIESGEDGAEQITNPLPDDATSTQEEVVNGWDGGIYAADDPRRIKPA